MSFLLTEKKKNSSNIAVLVSQFYGHPKNNPVKHFQATELRRVWWLTQFGLFVEAEGKSLQWVSIQLRGWKERAKVGRVVIWPGIDSV